MSNVNHIAFLKPKYFKKIINKEKTIESRWYKYKKPPFQQISVNDILYLKESGKPVSAKANVSKVLFFDNLNPKKIKQLLKKYGKNIGVEMSFFNEIKDKKFCILVFFKNLRNIKPFEINKSGYGNRVAWIVINDISKIKI